MRLNELIKFSEHLREHTKLECYVVEGENLLRLKLGGVDFFFIKDDTEQYDGYGKKVKAKVKDEV